MLSIYKQFYNSSLLKELKSNSYENNLHQSPKTSTSHKAESDTRLLYL